VRVLDLFCGRLGWSKAFLARGWEAVGVDLVEPPEIPAGFTFLEFDILELCLLGGELRVDGRGFDFIVASSPCEQFSKFGMPNFYPDPPYPSLGIRLFNHTREICEASGIPYVMENVWGAQKFVGDAAMHCGPFFLWGSGLPAIMPQGFRKGGRLGTGGWQHTGSKNKKENAAMVATIPPELSACVADYAERLLEVPNGKH
jgi:hypothetical protein